MTRTRSTLVLVLTVCSVVATLGVASAHAAEPLRASPAGSGATHDFRVVTHNIAGGTASFDSSIAPVVAKIAEVGPDAVMLQEVCPRELAAFRAQYPTWTVAFEPLRVDNPSCHRNGEPAGVNLPTGQVIASKWPAVEVPAHLLDTYGGKRFTLKCLDLTVEQHTRTVRACVTHLRVGDPTEVPTPEEGRLVETEQIERFLHNGGWTTASNKAAVVAGDMNAGPQKDSMSNMYRLTKTNPATFTQTTSELTGPSQISEFFEADQTDEYYMDKVAHPGVTCQPVGTVDRSCRTGEKTTDGATKIDHIFFSRNAASKSTLSADASDTPLSDHDVYWGRTMMTLN
jgi:endonuclease/exonuclease/phosphatase family metal-dependent hydrolase